MIDGVPAWVPNVTCAVPNNVPLPSKAWRLE